PRPVARRRDPPPRPPPRRRLHPPRRPPPQRADPAEVEGFPLAVISPFLSSRAYRWVCLRQTCGQTTMRSGRPAGAALAVRLLVHRIPAGAIPARGRGSAPALDPYAAVRAVAVAVDGPAGAGQDGQHIPAVEFGEE